MPGWWTIIHKNTVQQLGGCTCQYGIPAVLQTRAHACFSRILALVYLTERQIFKLASVAMGHGKNVPNVSWNGTGDNRQEQQRVQPHAHQKYS